MASGTITPDRPRFYRIVENGQTYSFNLELTDTARFRGGILMQIMKENPPVWILSVDTGSTPAVKNYKLSGGSSSTTISSASMSGTTLTVTFNAMTYGGVMLIWFD